MVATSTQHGARWAVPSWLAVPAALAAVFVVLPLFALLLRVDWAGLPDLVGSPAARTALALSLRTSAAATVLCIVLGVPLAVLLARTRFPGRGLLRAAVLLPLVLPPVVAGVALLATFGRQGLLGQVLELGGVRVAFTTTAVVIAQAFVSLPFLVIALEGALVSVGTGYEAVAATLGARPTMVLRRVTLPLVGPALLSGVILAFARALGEFGATITFAGSLAGTTRTLPLQVYLLREVDPDAANALALLLVLVAALVIGATGRGVLARGLAGQADQ